METRKIKIKIADKDIIRRLDQSKLSEADKQYIEDQSVLWEKVNKYGMDFFDMGREEGLEKGLEEGLEQGEKKKSIEIATPMLLRRN